jgi:hypothetical protein
MPPRRIARGHWRRSLPVVPAAASCGAATDDPARHWIGSLLFRGLHAHDLQPMRIHALRG